ncbi:MAG: class I SAM-dependent methyltransferase [Candidatus Brocadiia bacterium]|jgi:SAM-dependent methyltransferase
MFRWFETLGDRFWLKPDAEGESESKFIRKALHLRRAMHVLDAPCGAGRVAVHLAMAGCAVSGIDLRPQFIRRARDRFRQAGVAGEFHVMDLRQITFENAFHGIYNWLGSFGYFDESANEELVRRYARALRSGGRLLIEQPNRERILRHFLKEVRDGDLVQRNRWDARTQRVVSRRIVGGKENPRDVSSVRLYTLQQMRRLYEKSGLRVEGVYDSRTGEPFTRGSRRIAVVGVKG